ncbi:MAG: PilZ domain-containing protein [Nitrospira sp.]|nr:PilZ domain-containing protein [Nitrospira sp.]
MKNQRKHERVHVQFRSHFSMKGKMLAGDGDLTDLSPGGCRILSSVQVLVGAEVELCIFPGTVPTPFSSMGPPCAGVSRTNSVSRLRRSECLCSAN